MAKINDIDVATVVADALNAKLTAMSSSLRQANCPYCHEGKPLVDDNVSYVAVEHSAGLLWFNSDKFVGDNETEFVHISYCPMCGRRLDD